MYGLHILINVTTGEQSVNSPQKPKPSTTALSVTREVIFFRTTTGPVAAWPGTFIVVTFVNLKNKD